MGAALPKAFLPVCGRPIVLYCLDTLTRIANLDSMVVVASEDQLAAAGRILERPGGWPVRIEVVSGGAERQDSVAKGLAVTDPRADLVMIHDAARPFVSQQCVEACVSAAAAHGAAIVALPALDTIKLCDASVIRETLDRRHLWLAQTPQIFRSDWLRQAYAKARQEGILATDDSALVEHCGHAVHVVPGEASNRKLTTPDDLCWAEWFLQQTAD
jgi:2-C-methyl-D-erythritol 4-phosphate cytidylyltransferase